MGHASLIHKALRAWNRRRMAALLPGLMKDFYLRDPLEVLDCADAVRDYYERRLASGAPLHLVRRRTGECLASGTCEGLTT